jgi:hypothetical protein
MYKIPCHLNFKRYDTGYIFKCIILNLSYKIDQFQMEIIFFFFFFVNQIDNELLEMCEMTKKDIRKVFCIFMFEAN